MRHVDFNIYSAGGVETYYYRVPVRCTLKSLNIMANATLVATGTIIASRDTTAVNTATAPTGDVAAGVNLAGVPDATNKGLVFDPESATVANTKIKFVFDTTILGGVANVTLHMELDDSAYVAETPSEA
jgi:hypothetical protein